MKFDIIFVHSRAVEGATELDVDLGHLCKVFEAMRESKLYEKLKKCIFCAPEIPVLYSYVSEKGVHADSIDLLMAGPEGPEASPSMVGFC